MRKGWFRSGGVQAGSFFSGPSLLPSPPPISRRPRVKDGFVAAAFRPAVFLTCGDQTGSRICRREHQAIGTRGALCEQCVSCKAPLKIKHDSVCTLASHHLHALYARAGNGGRAGARRKFASSRRKPCPAELHPRPRGNSACGCRRSTRCAARSAGFQPAFFCAATAFIGCRVSRRSALQFVSARLQPQRNAAPLERGFSP